MTKIGSYRLAIHRRGARRKFFHDPFLFQNYNLPQMSFVDDDMKQRANTKFLFHHSSNPSKLILFRKTKQTTRKIGNFNYYE